MEGIQKLKKYELQNIKSEFKQYKLYEILTYNSKQTKKFSRTFEIRVQRSLILPT